MPLVGEVVVHAQLAEHTLVLWLHAGQQHRDASALEPGDGLAQDPGPGGVHRGDPRHAEHDDTHAVHVSLNEKQEVVLDAVIKGDTVKEVLDYVEFDVEHLLGKMRMDVESAVRAGRLDYLESGRLLRFYEEGLHGYTYLEDPNDR